MGAENEKRRFKLVIAYDGRPYDGWQSQVSGNTIQDILLAGLQSICPAVKMIQGSGRTDAGVSAEGQVAHFDTPGEWRMGGDEWRKALNTKIPPTIRILAAVEVPGDFHARFGAIGKCYRYRIATGDVLPPLQVGLAWHRRGLAGKERLSEVLGLYEGTHQFRLFAANRNDGKDETRDAERTIFEASVVESGDHQLDLHFHGNGFLYKMVRFLVGTAVYCVEGRVSMSEIDQLLKEQGATKAPYCAPPDGLSLQSVHYPAE
ncbi:MAG: tRNA pseudouridine(38-40) synthase TruA [Verrucomicrobiales bacterium]|nr:tRNA pseudouridine(38-40) synthase TruA [Verrucomicrobiales bacterium]